MQRDSAQLLNGGWGLSKIILFGGTKIFSAWNTRNYAIVHKTVEIYAGMIDRQQWNTMQQIFWHKYFAMKLT